MTNDQYLAIQQQLSLLSAMIRPLDLPSFIGAIEHAETVGPFEDPTLYRKAIKRLEAIRVLAQAFRDVQIADLALNEILTSGPDVSQCPDRATPDRPTPWLW